MAKIVITVDTDTKELSATIDGVQVPEIMYVSASKYQDYDESDKSRVSCNLELKPSESEDGALRINTCINAYANKNPDINIELSTHKLRYVSQAMLNASVCKWLGK